MNDHTGRPITPGCYLVYPGRRFSSLYVTLAYVKEVTDNGRLIVQPLDNVTKKALGKSATLQRTDLVTVVDLPNTSVA